MKSFYFVLLNILILLNFNLSFAEEEISKEKEEVDPKYQEIVTECKKYLTTVPSDIRQEVETYRIKVSEINKSKKELYKKLSQEAQGYLKTEQSYKKKLPLKIRKDITKQATSEQDKDSKSKK